MSAAGDLNGDGIADIIIGAYWAGTNTVITAVIFGQNSPENANLDLLTFPTGPTTGFLVYTVGILSAKQEM